MENERGCGEGGRVHENTWMCMTKWDFWIAFIGCISSSVYHTYSHIPEFWFLVKSTVLAMQWFLSFSSHCILHLFLKILMIWRIGMRQRYPSSKMKLPVHLQLMVVCCLPLTMHKLRALIKQVSPALHTAARDLKLIKEGKNTQITVFRIWMKHHRQTAGCLEATTLDQQWVQQQQEKHWTSHTCHMLVTLITPMTFQIVLSVRLRDWLVCYCLVDMPVCAEGASCSLTVVQCAEAMLSPTFW